MRSCGGLHAAVRAALAFLALAATPRLEPADLDAVVARGAIRVLADTQDDPTWFSADAGVAPGFEREVLEGFARRHRLRFVVVPIASWADAIPMLLADKADLLAGVNATPARRRQVDFTAELLPARQLAVSRRPQPPIGSLQELRSARVAVVPHTTWADALAVAGVPVSSTLPARDVTAALELLRSGRATATVIDELDFLVRRRDDRDLQAGMSLGEALSSAWAVRKEDARLRKALDDYLLELRSSANWSRLLVKYYGEDAPAVLGRAGKK